MDKSFYSNLFLEFLNNRNYLFKSPLLKYKGLFDLSIINSGLVLKAYPTTKQASFIQQTLKDACFVFNKTLEYNIFSYEQLGKMLTPLVTDLKCDFPWLSFHNNTDSLALANAQQNLRKAWNKYFNEKNINKPKFKKSKYFVKYTTNNQKGSIKYVNKDGFDYLQLPKLGLVKINKHREI